MICNHYTHTSKYGSGAPSRRIYPSGIKDLTTAILAETAPDPGVAPSRLISHLLNM